MPFRFGVVTLTAAPQAFVRVRIRLEDGREGWGAGAEILAPKWFDKNLALSNEDNFDQLRLALRLARDAYLDARRAHRLRPLRRALPRGRSRPARDTTSIRSSRASARRSSTARSSTRCAGCSGCRSTRRCRATSPASRRRELAPDLAGFDIDAFLARLQPADSIAARHTVGLVDVIAGHPRAGRTTACPSRWKRSSRRYGHTLVQAEGRRERRRGRRAARRRSPRCWTRSGGRLPRLARRQRAVRRPRRAAGAARADERAAAARAARRRDRLHRAADQPQARARARRLRGVAHDAGDRRRVGRGPRRLPAREGARLLGRLVEDVQGALQVDPERGALRAVEHARRAATS